MSNVFSWKNKNTWPLSWPEIKIEPDSYEAYEYSNNFIEKYECIYLYHACRPSNPSSYYKNGIQKSNHNKLMKDVVNILSTIDNSLTEELIVKSAKKINSGIDNHKVFLSIDDREFINGSSGHYLIYGSEFIFSIANFFNCQQNLTTTGIPTIFEVILPVSQLEKIEIATLSSYILRYKYNEINSPICITLNKSVHPKFISSHYHPDKIFNPFTKSFYCYKNEFHK